MTLRVGFDDQIFQAQRRGGISKYFVEIVSRLPDHGIEPLILSIGTRNLHLLEAGLVPPAAPATPWRERLDWVTWRLIGRPDTAPRPRPAVDVIHHTFTHGAYLRRAEGPRVVTVFDMTPEVFPGYFRWGNPHFAKRAYARRADAVIAISKNTADDMLRFYGDGLAVTTRVIPFGVAPRFFEPGPAPARLPNRYVLFVGVRAGYKDFPLALEAFRRVGGHDPGLAFVVVGGGPFDAHEERAVLAAGIADRVVRLAPSDDQMPEVYRRAAAFLFPSRYEGFGLPTLEALAQGVPTVLADASCSREVGGSAALYFPPGDVDTLTLRLREALSPAGDARSRSLGPEHARAFDWDDVTARTADVYRTVAGRG